MQHALVAHGSIPATQNQQQQSQPPTCRSLALPRHTLSPNFVCLYLYQAHIACIPHRNRYTGLAQAWRVCPVTPAVQSGLRNKFPGHGLSPANLLHLLPAMPRSLSPL